jgi:hypothetical protein
VGTGVSLPGEIVYRGAVMDATGRSRLEVYDDSLHAMETWSL